MLADNTMQNIIVWQETLKLLAKEAYRRDKEESRTFRYSVKQPNLDIEKHEMFPDVLFVGSIITAVWSEVRGGMIMFRIDNRIWHKMLTDMEFSPIDVLDEFENAWNLRFEVSEKFLKRYFETGKDGWSIAINLNHEFAQIHLFHDTDFKVHRHKCSWDELEILDVEKLFE